MCTDKSGTCKKEKWYFLHPNLYQPPLLHYLLDLSKYCHYITPAFGCWLWKWILSKLLYNKNTLITLKWKLFFLGFDFPTYLVGFEIACFETCRPVGRLALSLAGYQRVPLTHFQYSQYLAQQPTFDRFPLSWVNRGLICRSDSIYWLRVLWDCLLDLYSCPRLKSHQESFQEFAINPGKLRQTNITSATTSKSI